MKLILSFVFFLSLSAVIRGQITPSVAPSQPNAPQSGHTNVASTLHVFAYPRNNQSEDQQFKDETDCYQWAQAQAGQPAAADQAQEGANPSDAGKGAGAAGAARGAAGGAAIGAIAGSPGKGAGIGAVAGTMAGRKTKREAQTQAQKQQQQQQQAQQAQLQDDLRRAYSACMEVKDYTVK
ncbi:MAG TPA: hypothetical protein VI488_15180 [Candidatus Angelobacter sp.]